MSVLGFTGSRPDREGLWAWGWGTYPEESPISRIFFRSVLIKTMMMSAAIHEAGRCTHG